MAARVVAAASSMWMNDDTPGAPTADGEAATPDALKLELAFAERRALSVEASVPKDRAIDAVCLGHRSLEVQDRLEVRRRASGGS
jgi:hypothetical protein